MAPQEEFDDDDFVDHYDEPDEDGDELSPEDKIAMEDGTAEVQKALGVEATKVTVSQIQEALWHYYYDVDKSVTYLTKTFIAPPPPKTVPKKTPEGKLSVISLSASHSLFPRATGADCEPLEHECGSGHFYNTSFAKPFPVLEKPRVSPELFFSDMPWLNIPRHRETVFFKPPCLPGGLLGGGDGGPKMSKLQALAAARKKKIEDKKGQEDHAKTERGLNKLAISDERQKENLAFAAKPNTPQIKEASPFGHAAALSTEASSHSEKEPLKNDVRHINESFGSSTNEFPRPGVGGGEAPTLSHASTPSAFARTLFRSAPGASQTSRQDVFAMPYTQSSSFFATEFAKPSPDDIVLAAQAKAGKKAPTTPKTSNKTPKKDDGAKDAGVANSVSNLRISDAPPPKSKGLDVIKEFENSTSKRSASFVVVGHVDAGKSTLMGRLLLELKLVDERTVDKYRRQAEKSGKQSFALAWVMDQSREERDRGVTIDIATNYFETEKTKFTILDAPGHQDFVPNMIAGASQADFAILVIDANTGAYEKGLKGQTREHVLLLRSLGVQRLIVAVNKLDMVGWSQDRFNEISEEVSGFLTGLGFQDKFVSFIPISGLNGDNIVQRTKDQDASWYTGPTLIDGLEGSVVSATRALKKPFRMAISEVFRSQQGTATLGGRIDSGTIQIGDVVLVQPSGENAYIKSIVVDSVTQEWAVAGQSISLALTNIDPVHIRIGDILCHTADPINIGDTFTMKAMAFNHLLPMPVDLHRGRLHAAGQIQSIAATLDKVTGEVIKKKPKVVQPGAVARILIKLESKVPLESGQRVVIRSGGETIAAGLLE